MEKENKFMLILAHWYSWPVGYTRPDASSSLRARQRIVAELSQNCPRFVSEDARDSSYSVVYEFSPKLDGRMDRLTLPADETVKMHRFIEIRGGF